MGNVEADWDLQKVVEGGEYDGRWLETDSAMSTVHCDSEQVETDALATCQVDQHKQCQCMTSNIPEPSKLPPIDHR